MASQIDCDMCNAEPARMMQSDLTDGTTVAVGQNCLFVYFYNAAVGCAPEGFFDETPEQETEPVEAKPKRTRKPKTQPQPVDEPIEEFPEVPPANMTRDADGNVVPL